MKIVSDNTVDIDAARVWLVEHKAAEALSWNDIGKLTDVNYSTLSLFAGSKYAGDNGNVATKIIAYRNRLSAQAAIGADAPRVPEWYETETSREIAGLLHWAQAGRIVLIVTGPGIGKTITARRFASADPNVWLATMAPSSAGVATMACEVAAVIGLGEIKGSPQQLSRQIRNHVQGKKGLLIVDEAQELTDKAINEIRGWHDRTGVGVALLGNDKVVGQLDSRKSALAQVSSRFSIRRVQAAALPADIEALLDAWRIEDDAQRAFLARIGAMPGALREMTHTIELAVLSAAPARPTLGDLRDAARRRNVKIGSL